MCQKACECAHFTREIGWKYLKVLLSMAAGVATWFLTCLFRRGGLLSERSGWFVTTWRLAQKARAPAGQIDRMASSAFLPRIDLLQNYCLESLILTR